MKAPGTFSTQRVSRTLRALGVALLLATATPAFAHHLEKRFAVGAHPVIIVHNPSGTITIKSWNRPEVLVVADHASEKVEVDAAQTANRVDVSTHLLSETVSPADLRADYQITVPEDAELELHNDSGAVDVTDVLGDMVVETVAAGVQLEDTAGYLSVKTVGGSFDCARCSGRIEAQSISGNLRIRDARSSSVRVQTSTGNILFDGEFLPNGTYRLKNYSGSIEVRFSPADSFDLSATSLHGKVENEAFLRPPAHSSHQPPRFAQSEFGTFNLGNFKQGRAKVELTSFSGTIKIRKRD